MWYTIQQLWELIKTLDPTKLYKIVEVKTRTSQQNNYLWGTVYPFLANWMNKKAERMGIPDRVDKDSVHEYCKYMFNAKHIGKVRLGMSTKKMNTKEFIAYTEAIQRFAMKYYDTYIPDPNEEEYNNWIDNINN